MGERQKRSFSEVAFVEAVARRATAYLVIRPVRPGAQTRLFSRFLGIHETASPVLAAPRTQTTRQKVFLPVGWDVTMTFPVGDFLLQARTRVLGHCQFPQGPTRRIDAIIIERAGKVVSLNRRSQERRQVAPSTVIPASAWPAAALETAFPSGLPDPDADDGGGPAEVLNPLAPQTGMLANWSQGGLGIRFDRKLKDEIGSEMIIRLEDPAAEVSTIYRGMLKHCTRQPGGKWLAGFGEVVEIGPGQAVPIMDRLVALGR